MPVIKLNKNHTESVKHLFENKKYMGVHTNSTELIKTHADLNFNSILYETFCTNYLSDLNSFHAFGYIDEENKVQSLISFYESIEEPSWYYTVYRSSGNNNLLREVLDQVIDYNESNGRLKFYSLTNANHTKLLRKFHWSKYNDERYGFFDEFLVPAKNKCFYINHWELLYKRFLVPNDSIVRCNYLKQEYRLKLPIGGNI